MRKETEDGRREDLTEEEVDGVFAMVDTTCKAMAKNRIVKVEGFGVAQGQVRIALRDQWSKTVVEGSLHGLKNGLKVSDKFEDRNYKRYTLWVPTRRGSPEEFMTWMRETYKVEGIEKEDIRVYVNIAKEKGKGNTIVMGLSEKAVEVFGRDGMSVYVGAGRYELKDWTDEEEKEKQKKTQEGDGKKAE